MSDQTRDLRHGQADTYALILRPPIDRLAESTAS